MWNVTFLDWADPVALGTNKQHLKNNVKGGGQECPPHMTALTAPSATVRFRLYTEYPEVIALSRPEKTHHHVNLPRRNFLTRCCQGAAATLIPASLRGFNFDPAATGPYFHLHPHYRAQRPLAAT